MAEPVAVGILRDLVAIPSIGGSEAEVTVQHHLAERLAGLGLAVDLWPLDLAALRADPGYPGEEVPRDRAWGLVATNRPGERPGLVLQGHVDVVPVGDPAAWHSDPFTATLRDGRVIGRGSCDMKGGLAAILAAVAQAARSPDELPPFAVHCVVGEEDGGIGAFGTLARGHTGEACVIPEPTGAELVVGNAGSLTFRIDVPGLATHGSTPYAGSSALTSYLAIHTALADLERARNTRPEPLLAHLPVAYPISVGRVRAGDWPSSVPDRLVAEGRMGLRLTEDPADARKALEQAVAEAAAAEDFLRDHPPRVSWPGGTFRGGQLPDGHPLAAAVASAHAEVTGTPPLPGRAAPYGSDLRLYAAAGVPTLHYGPGEVRLAHGPDESVPVDQLGTVTDVLARLLRRPVPTLPPPRTSDPRPQPARPGPG